MHRKKSSHSAAFRPTWLRLLKCIYQIIFFLNAVDTHGLTPVALAKEVCIYLEGCMPSNSL
jgi:hypothetical protein